MELERVVGRGESSLRPEYRPSNCSLCVFRSHCGSILNKNLWCYSLGFHYSFINNNIYWVLSMCWAHSSCCGHRGEKKVSALMGVCSNTFETLPSPGSHSSCDPYIVLIQCSAVLIPHFDISEQYRHWAACANTVVDTSLPFGISQIQAKPSELVVRLFFTRYTDWGAGV